MRILGIDPSIRSTGYGVIETTGGKSSALAWGTIPNPASRSQAGCLLNIVETLRAVIHEHTPDEAAVEQILYVQSVRTAIAMGSARGAALIAIAEAGLPLHEYPPKSVKKASTGVGSAQKQQVGFMMRALLGLRETPAPDAADALAIALTHAQRQAFRTAAGGQK
jgi:crossover junction endodeoxyribonuclease RuvC